MPQLRHLRASVSNVTLNVLGLRGGCCQPDCARLSQKLNRVLHLSLSMLRVEDVTKVTVPCKCVRIDRVTSHISGEQSSTLSIYKHIYI